VYEVIKGLSARHDVSVLAMGKPTPESREAIAELRRQDLDVRDVPVPTRSRSEVAFSAWRARRSMYGCLYWSTAFASALDATLRRDAFDIVQCEFAYLGAYAPPRPRNGGPRWVLDAHNVEFRLNETLAQTAEGISGLIYRAYSEREARLRRREEIEACLRVDRVVTVSASDREILLSEAPGLAVDIVPNGIDLNRFVTSGASEPARPASAVFVGKMDYRPNIDAVLWFCREILPLVRNRIPEFTFTICGGHPVDAVLELRRIDGVLVTGRVPDTRPFLDGAALVVVPLRAGSGTRLKVLEAMAMARPVVSTPFGVEGLNVVPGEHFVEAGSAEEFAGRVLQLLGDPGFRERLGRAGRGLVETFYGWPSIVSSLTRVYSELLEAPAAHEVER